MMRRRHLLWTGAGVYSPRYIGTWYVLWVQDEDAVAGVNLTSVQHAERFAKVYIQEN